MRAELVSAIYISYQLAQTVATRCEISVYSRLSATGEGSDATKGERKGNERALGEPRKLVRVVREIEIVLLNLTYPKTLYFRRFRDERTSSLTKTSRLKSHPLPCFLRSAAVADAAKRPAAETGNDRTLMKPKSAAELAAAAASGRSKQSKRKARAEEGRQVGPVAVKVLSAHPLLPPSGALLGFLSLSLLSCESEIENQK